MICKGPSRSRGRRRRKWERKQVQATETMIFSPFKTWTRTTKTQIIIMTPTNQEKTKWNTWTQDKGIIVQARYSTTLMCLQWLLWILSTQMQGCTAESHLQWSRMLPARVARTSTLHRTISTGQITHMTWVRTTPRINFKPKILTRKMTKNQLRLTREKKWGGI